MAVESVSAGQLTLSFVPRALESSMSRYLLNIKFDSNSTTISSLEVLPGTMVLALPVLTPGVTSQLSPPDVPVDDLLFVAGDMHLIHTLCSELSNRLHSHLRLQAEITKLSQRYCPPLHF